MSGLQPAYLLSIDSQVEKNLDGLETTQVSLNPASITRVLSALTFILVIASLSTAMAYELTGNSIKTFERLVKIFSVDLELNVPTFFSMLMMLFAGVLLSLISVIKRKQKTTYVFHWAILSGGFLFMAFDEIVAAHERIVEPMRAILGGENLGIFYYAWVVPGIALILFLACVFMRFWWNLPPKTRLNFAIAAALFLSGAIGVEMIGGQYAETNGKENLTYIIITTFEETLEMVSLIVFIRGLFDYITETLCAVKVGLVKPRQV